MLESSEPREADISEMTLVGTTPARSELTPEMMLSRAGMRPEGSVTGSEVTVGTSDVRPPVSNGTGTTTTELLAASPVPPRREKTPADSPCPRDGKTPKGVGEGLGACVRISSTAVEVAEASPPRIVESPTRIPAGVVSGAAES